MSETITKQKRVTEINSNIDYLFSKINFGASFLDAKAIEIMNTLKSDISALVPDVNVSVEEKLSFIDSLIKYTIVCRLHKPKIPRAKENSFFPAVGLTKEQAISNFTQNFYKQVQDGSTIEIVGCFTDEELVEFNKTVETKYMITYRKSGIEKDLYFVSSGLDEKQAKTKFYEVKPSRENTIVSCKNYEDWKLFK